MVHHFLLNVGRTEVRVVEVRAVFAHRVDNHLRFRSELRWGSWFLCAAAGSIIAAHTSAKNVHFRV